MRLIVERVDPSEEAVNMENIITDVTARKVFNSRGSLTIEVQVTTEKGFGKAIAPSGASKGLNEVPSYPKGGVDEAINLIRVQIASKLQGENVNEQERIDKLLREIDGSDNFQKIGGNTSIAISIAAAKASASAQGIHLFQKFNETSDYIFPFPLGNVIGGGKHAGRNTPDIQEFLSLPTKVRSFYEAATANIKVHELVRTKIDKIDMTFTGGKGDEGAWAPNLNNQKAIEILSNVCEEISNELGITIRTGLDVASSSFWDFKTERYIYTRDNVTKDSGEQIEYIMDLIKMYHLAYVEDPVHEEDFEGFSEITKKTKNCLICGDDLFTTNIKRLAIGIEKKAGNAIIIKPNQIGTLTDTYEAVKLAKKSGYITIASHRSGESCDPYLAHIALAFFCPIIKLGIVGGERMSKINELIRIEESLKKSSSMTELNI
jgi:enolase